MRESSRSVKLCPADRVNPLKYAYMGARSRFIILFHWLAGRRNGVSAGELLRHLRKKPNLAVGRSVVEEVGTEGDFYVYRLQGINTPVYYPREYDLHSFCICNCASFVPDDWHFYEVPETRIAAGDTVLDCGAAEGVFSLVAASRCEKVYAVEPLPRFIAALEKTFEEVDNVRVLPFALTDRAGEVAIVDLGFASSIVPEGNEGSTKVKATTIDELFFERGIGIDFIKADLEGHEIEVLKGAERTIRENTPKIAITTYHCKEHAEAISRFLSSIDSGYRFRTKGINEFGTPFMLHAWVDL